MMDRREAARHKVHPAQGRFSILRRAALSLGMAGGVILALSTLCGFFGELTWYLDLFSHFRAQYFGGLALLTLLFVVLRHVRIAACLALIALLNLLVLIPLYQGPAQEPLLKEVPIRAVLLNVNTTRGDPGLTSDMLQQLDADIVALVEVNRRWLDELQEALRPYPYSKVVAREDNFGIALFSKVPLSRAETVYLGPAEIPSLIAEMESGQHRLQLIVTHPMPPISEARWRERNAHLSELAQLVRELPAPVMVLGDLNITPWSPHFQRLLLDGGLQDSARGYGIQPTWPTWLPPMLIPIDHCLYSDGIIITDRMVDPYVESDHFPVVVDFVVTKKD